MKQNKIILTGDWHIGMIGTNMKQLEKVRDNSWRDYPIILMGDLIDCGIDRGMEFSNEINPQEQRDKVQEFTKDLAIKGYVLGNHEYRIFEKTGLNPYKSMFKSTPKREYTIDDRKIFVNHGKSTAENAFLEHTKYAKWVDADLIALGHSHVLGKLTVLYASKLRHYVRTGHMMPQPEYASQAGFAPLMKGWVEYDLDANVVHLAAIVNGKVKEI